MMNNTVVASSPWLKYSQAATASTTIQYNQFSIMRRATIQVVTMLPQVTKESTYGAGESVQRDSAQPFSALTIMTSTATVTCWLTVHDSIRTSPDSVRPRFQSMNPYTAITR